MTTMKLGEDTNLKFLGYPGDDPDGHGTGHSLLLQSLLGAQLLLWSSLHRNNLSQKSKCPRERSILGELTNVTDRRRHG